MTFTSNELIEHVPPLRNQASLLVATGISGESYLALLPIWIKTCSETLSTSSRPWTILLVSDSEFASTLVAFLKKLYRKNGVPKWLAVHIVPVDKKVENDFFTFKQFLRYHLVNWPDLDKYGVVLQTDLDVLIVKHLDKEIEQMKPMRYYVTQEGDHTQRYYSLGEGYSKKELEDFAREQVRSFNAGTFAFLFSKEMRDSIRQMLDWAEQEIRSGTKYFGDQSFVNVWMNRRRLADTALLSSVMMPNAGALDPRIFKPMKKLWHVFGEHTIGGISPEEVAKAKKNPNLMQNHARLAAESKSKLMKMLFHRFVCKRDCIKDRTERTTKVDCLTASSQYMQQYGATINRAEFRNAWEHFVQVGMWIFNIWTGTEPCESYVTQRFTKT